MCLWRADILKIYTGFGDAGQTHLYGGQVVAKDDLRVEAYGTADELNSQLGLLVSTFSNESLIEFVRKIQGSIFKFSAELATPENKKSKTRPHAIQAQDIKDLERKIDQLDGDLPALKNFILPGGAPEAARAHLARTICRRLERRLVSLKAHSPVDPLIIIYINRLSDFLFVLARTINKSEGIEDIPWKGGN